MCWDCEEEDTEFNMGPHFLSPPTSRADRMPRQVLFATMWGVLDNSVGRYPLEKLPQVR
jgi:hypothetical protein